MSYTIEIDEKENLIYLTLKGLISLKAGIASRKELAQFVKKTGIKKVIVDQSEGRVDVTISELFEFHSSHNEVLPNQIKIAIIVSKEEIADNMKFAENVAINRGIDIKVFTSVNEGIKWLNI